MCIKVHFCRYCTQTYPEYDSILPCRLPPTLYQHPQPSYSPLARPSFRFDTPPAYSSPTSSPKRAPAPNFSLPSSPAPLRSNPISIAILPARSDNVAVGPPTPTGRRPRQESVCPTDSPTLGILSVPRIAGPKPVRTSAINPFVPPRRSSLQHAEVSPLSPEDNNTADATRREISFTVQLAFQTPQPSQIFPPPPPRHNPQTSRTSHSATPWPIPTQPHPVSAPPTLSLKPRYSPNIPEPARQCKDYPRRWAYVTCGKCGEAVTRKIAAEEEYQLARKMKRGMKRVEGERGRKPICLDSVLRPQALEEGEKAYGDVNKAGRKKKTGVCVMMSFLVW